MCETIRSDALKLLRALDTKKSFVQNVALLHAKFRQMEDMLLDSSTVMDRLELSAAMDWAVLDVALCPLMSTPTGSSTASPSSSSPASSIYPIALPVSLSDSLCRMVSEIFLRFERSKFSQPLPTQHIFSKLCDQIKSSLKDAVKNESAIHPGFHLHARVFCLMQFYTNASVATPAIGIQQHFPSNPHRFAVKDPAFLISCCGILPWIISEKSTHQKFFTMEAFTFLTKVIDTPPVPAPVGLTSVQHNSSTSSGTNLSANTSPAPNHALCLAATSSLYKILNTPHLVKRVDPNNNAAIWGKIGDTLLKVVEDPNQCSGTQSAALILTTVSASLGLWLFHVADSSSSSNNSSSTTTTSLTWDGYLQRALRPMTRVVQNTLADSIGAFALSITSANMSLLPGIVSKLLTIIIPTSEDDQRSYAPKLIAKSMKYWSSRCGSEQIRIHICRELLRFIHPNVSHHIQALTALLSLSQVLSTCLKPAVEALQLSGGANLFNYLQPVFMMSPSIASAAYEFAAFAASYNPLFLHHLMSSFGVECDDLIENIKDTTTNQSHRVLPPSFLQLARTVQHVPVSELQPHHVAHLLHAAQIFGRILFDGRGGGTVATTTITTPAAAPSTPSSSSFVMGRTESASSLTGTVTTPTAGSSLPPYQSPNTPTTPHHHNTTMLDEPTLRRLELCYQTLAIASKKVYQQSKWTSKSKMSSVKFNNGPGDTHSCGPSLQKNVASLTNRIVLEHLPLLSSSTNRLSSAPLLKVGSALSLLLLARPVTTNGSLGEESAVEPFVWNQFFSKTLFLLTSDAGTPAFQAAVAKFKTDVVRFWCERIVVLLKSPMGLTQLVQVDTMIRTALQEVVSCSQCGVPSGAIQEKQLFLSPVASLLAPYRRILVPLQFQGKSACLDGAIGALSSIFPTLSSHVQRAQLLSAILDNGGSSGKFDHQFVAAWNCVVCVYVILSQAYVTSSIPKSALQELVQQLRLQQTLMSSSFLFSLTLDVRLVSAKLLALVSLLTKDSSAHAKIALDPNPDLSALPGYLCGLLELHNPYLLSKDLAICSPTSERRAGPTSPLSPLVDDGGTSMNLTQSADWVALQRGQLPFTRSFIAICLKLCGPFDLWSSACNPHYHELGITFCYVLFVLSLDPAMGEGRQIAQELYSTVYLPLLFRAASNVSSFVQPCMAWDPTCLSLLSLVGLRVSPGSKETSHSVREGSGGTEMQMMLEVVHSLFGSCLLCDRCDSLAVAACSFQSVCGSPWTSAPALWEGWLELALKSELPSQGLSIPSFLPRIKIFSEFSFRVWHGGDDAGSRTSILPDPCNTLDLPENILHRLSLIYRLTTMSPSCLPPSLEDIARWADRFTGRFSDVLSLNHFNGNEFHNDPCMRLMSQLYYVWTEQALQRCLDGPTNIVSTSAAYSAPLQSMVSRLNAILTAKPPERTQQVLKHRNSFTDGKEGMEGAVGSRRVEYGEGEIPEDGLASTGFATTARRQEIIYVESPAKVALLECLTTLVLQRKDVGSESKLLGWIVPLLSAASALSEVHATLFFPTLRLVKAFLSAYCVFDEELRESVGSQQQNRVLPSELQPQVATSVKDLIGAEWAMGSFLDGTLLSLLQALIPGADSPVLVPLPFSSLFEARPYLKEQPGEARRLCLSVLNDAGLSRIIQVLSDQVIAQQNSRMQSGSRDDISSPVVLYVSKIAAAIRAPGREGSVEGNKNRGASWNDAEQSWSKTLSKCDVLLTHPTTQHCVASIVNYVILEQIRLFVSTSEGRTVASPVVEDAESPPLLTAPPEIEAVQSLTIASTSDRYGPNRRAEDQRPFKHFCPLMDHALLLCHHCLVGAAAMSASVQIGNEGGIAPSSESPPQRLVHPTSLGPTLRNSLGFLINTVLCTLFYPNTAQNSPIFQRSPTTGGQGGAEQVSIPFPNIDREYAAFYTSMTSFSVSLAQIMHVVSDAHRTLCFRLLLSSFPAQDDSIEAPSARGEQQLHSRSPVRFIGMSTLVVGEMVSSMEQRMWCGLDRRSSAPRGGNATTALLDDADDMTTLEFLVCWTDHWMEYWRRKRAHIHTTQTMNDDDGCPAVGDSGEGGAPLLGGGSTTILLHGGLANELLVCLSAVIVACRIGNLIATVLLPQKNSSSGSSVTTPALPSLKVSISTLERIYLSCLDVFAEVENSLCRGPKDLSDHQGLLTRVFVSLRELDIFPCALFVFGEFGRLCWGRQEICSTWTFTCDEMFFPALWILRREGREDCNVRPLTRLALMFSLTNCSRRITSSSDLPQRYDWNRRLVFALIQQVRMDPSRFLNDVRRDFLEHDFLRCFLRSLNNVSAGEMEVKRSLVDPTELMSFRTFIDLSWKPYLLRFHSIPAPYVAWQFIALLLSSVDSLVSPVPTPTQSRKHCTCPAFLAELLESILAKVQSQKRQQEDRFVESDVESECAALHVTFGVHLGASMSAREGVLQKEQQCGSMPDALIRIGAALSNLANTCFGGLIKEAIQKLPAKQFEALRSLLRASVESDASRKRIVEPSNPSANEEPNSAESSKKKLTINISSFT